MINEGHLSVYDLTLVTRSPLFIGSGTVKKENEYVFDSRSETVMMIDLNRLFYVLAEKGLVDEYERFVFSGKKQLYSFLHDVCKFSNMDIAGLCRYRVSAADALDENHSLKEIHTFVRNSADQVYVPGSSLKGALRTIILYTLVQESDSKGIWPNERSKGRNAQAMAKLEGEYLNTLNLKKDKTGAHVNDAVNSILRGFSISDSLPISDENITLAGKIDALPNGETKKLPLCRECVKPGTAIRFKLTLDHGVLGDKLTPEILTAYIREFSDYYEDFFVSAFTPPRDSAGVNTDNCIVLGGGSGFFAKSIAYPYFGFDGGLDYVAAEMIAQFRNHKHEKDINDHGISPHTMKYCKYNGRLYPYGVCEVRLV